jgi:hypothetical protein
MPPESLTLLEEMDPETKTAYVEKLKEIKNAAKARRTAFVKGNTAGVVEAHAAYKAAHVSAKEIRKSS